MGVAVVTGAKCMCTFGTMPSTLNATAQFSVLLGGIPAATVRDCIPMANLPPFGQCISLAFPPTAAATAASLGVLNPQPCIPAPVGVWMGGRTPLVGGVPALGSDASITCAYLGFISITYPGQTKVLY